MSTVAAVVASLLVGAVLGYVHGGAQRARAVAEAYGRGAWEGRRAERRGNQERAARRRDGL